ncbi:uncharacterized protein LOC122884257 isoform X2 [Siniperca chuatsi]|uniref:uncharacterized protein LOC122884257 isoform X2 n=1 Tax=Siniperca chuatsi TaxID=119488 RepID=UPI001CE07996|nr:uncharacterized protein LOC122884257 isoform X2 [Siniperca chuatsi]
MFITENKLRPWSFREEPVSLHVKHKAHSLVSCRDVSDLRDSAATPDSSAGRDQGGVTCRDQDTCLYKDQTSSSRKHTPDALIKPTAMSNFLSGALGNKGIGKMAGQKAGELVEDTVNKVMSGGKKKEGNNGGSHVGDVLSFGGGKKEGNNGGSHVGDVLSSGGGKKEDEGKGLNVEDVLEFN